MKKKIGEIWAEKKKLIIKIIAGVVAVALVVTGVSIGVIIARNAKQTEVSKTATTEKKDADNNDSQEDLLTNVIQSQVSGETLTSGKEENVYVISDANGSAKQVIVSDWLKNPSASKTIEDASDLTDITNVKGDETFTKKDDGTFTWQADGKDIYYQGNTTKALPVNVKISYFLDGKEMKADEMAGKSGKVTIRFDYENTEKKTVTISNKEEEVYVPFTVMSAMILPTDTFSDITVTNGKVMSEGSNNIILGLAFPGLQDSLQIDEKELKEKDIEIPDYVEVNAITSDFSLDMTLSVVLSDALSDIHLTDSIDLSEIDDDMGKLTDASSELEDGTKQLKDGVDTLSSKTGELSDGATKLSDAVVAYTGGVGTLAGGIDTLKSGTQTAADGASALASGAATAKSGADQLASQVPTLASGANDLSSGLNAYCGNVDILLAAYRASLIATLSGNGLPTDDASLATIAGGTYGADAAKAATAILGINTLLSKSSELTAGAQQLADGANTLASKVPELQSGLDSLASGADQLNSGVSQINSGADQLKSGADTLTANTAALVDGAAKLKDGASQFQDGVSKLSTGASDLNDGMAQFDKDGIQKLTDAFEGDGKKVLDRLNATMDAGHDYHTFTKLPEGVDGSVKFIIRTEAIQ